MGQKVEDHPLNKYERTLVLGYFFPLLLGLLVLGLLSLNLCFFFLIEKVFDFLSKIGLELLHLIDNTFDRDVREVILA